MAVNEEFGYWSASVSPLPYVERRFPVMQLENRLSEASVALRGWNYPHISRHAEDFTRTPGWIEGRTSWERYREVWRFHIDGLFTHRWRMREDGAGAFKGTIHFVAAIYTVAEVWEFTRRIYGQDEEVEEVRVILGLDNVRGRHGSGDSFQDLPYGSQAQRNSFRGEATIPRIDLLADIQGPALQMTIGLFWELGFSGISESFISERIRALLTGRI